MSSNITPIIARLRAELVRSQFTLTTLSKTAGLGTDTVARWIAGTRSPRAAELDSALRTLGFQLAVVPLDRDDASARSTAPK